MHFSDESLLNLASSSFVLIGLQTDGRRQETEEKKPFGGFCKAILDLDQNIFQ